MRSYRYLSLRRAAVAGAIVLLSACQAAPTMMSPAPSISRSVAGRPALPPLCPSYLTVYPPQATVGRGHRLALKAIMIYQQVKGGGKLPACVVIGSKQVLATWTKSGGHLQSYPSQELVDFWAWKRGSYLITANYSGHPASAKITVI